MCGISGLITKDYSHQELFEEINLMKKALAHRGPDDSGTWIDNKLGITLAHNRLSIIDLSEAGHQPMKSKSGRFIISFNGEIYNHIQIKERLNKELNVKNIWRGSSDTEVLLYSIESLGLKKTLDSIKGMFAFAIWDKLNNEMTLVRDRFGEKPLYWGFIKNLKNNSRNIAFASELKAFLGLKSFNNKISNKGLSQYFDYGYISAPNSIYENIYQLPPGNLLRINYAKFFENHTYIPESICWYNFLERTNSKKILNKTNTTEKLEQLLINSINSQNQADVPICTFLSGGIDSSTVAALLQKTSPHKINTMTISFPDYKESGKYFDEGPYAEKIAKFLGSNHTDIPITSNEALDIIPYLPEIYSEPFSDSSQIATYLLCKATKDTGYKVALTGDGSDELFGGYNRHIFLPKIYSIFTKAPAEIKNIINFMISRIPLSDKGLLKDKRQKLINSINKSKKIEDLYESLLNLWVNHNDNVLEKRFKNLHYKDLSLPKAQSIAERIMLKDLTSYLPSDILVKTDRASMANSIETRSPFLDHEIAEFSINIPVEKKSNSNKLSISGKIILREILRKHLPKELFKRPKSGFAVPIGTWLKGPLQEWANELLLEEKIMQQGYLDHKKVSKLWRMHKESKYDFTPQIWCILMWQSWLENN